MPVSALPLPRVGLCTSRSHIPLEHVDVRAEITAAHARVTCTQRYRNQELRPVEAVYVFPLDEGAAVCGFAAVVAGVRYEGVVKPREAAFAAYDDAIASGHGAFLLDEESQVRLEVYNLLGRQVATLATGRYPAGRHVVQWDARGAASGVYLYRIQAGSHVQTRSMTLLK